MTTAIVGAGLSLFAACGGATGGSLELSGEADDPDAYDPQGAAVGVISASRTMADGGEDAADDHADATEEAPYDAGQDGPVGPDASGDPSDASDASSSSDGGPALPTTFKMPAMLYESGCWMDEFPNPVCKTVPTTSPAIVDWGTCNPPAGTGHGELHMATLRVPPRTCLRISGRWDASKMSTQTCVSANCSADDIVCKMQYNNSDTDELFVRVHYKRSACAGGFTAWWYPINECPVFEHCR